MEGWELVSYNSANQLATSPADLPQVKPGIATISSQSCMTGLDIQLHVLNLPCRL